MNCLQFKNFVEKLSTEQISVQDGEVVEQKPEELASSWAEEFQHQKVHDLREVFYL